MKPTTLHDYRARMMRVLAYLVAHLDDKLALEDLASVAAFSPFHFHRIFRGMAGETVGDLVRRLKLERAAYQLRSEAASVTEAAFAAGYESPEAFARAFRRSCGLAPTAYRRTWPLPHFSQVLPRVLFDPARMSIDLEPLAGGTFMEISIERVPERRVMAIRLVGPYDQATGGFRSLISWAERVGIDWRRQPMFSLSYDDPESVPAAALRSDACLELPADTEPAKSDLPDGAELRVLPAFRYAVHRLVGSYDGIHPAYQRLFQLWLPTSGEEVADQPCMEVYLNDCESLPAKELLTDLCIPLKD